MPRVVKDKIKINAYDSMVELKSDDARLKYYKTIGLPLGANLGTAKSKYINGILEIIFDKKKETKLDGVFSMCS